MGAIRKLPPELVNQIAAGEVIERPASVVKELVENAVDAGARRIDVSVEDGGRRAIRVCDDGRGILAEDLPLAVASHATSKIAGLSDLFAIRTLGFRGEALASVGSIADLRVASRPPGAEGAEIRVRGGEAEEVRPAGVAPGTVVLVRDLFFNTPARRKFLREGPGELRACVEAMTRLALGAPGVALRLASEGRLVLETAPADDLLARIADLFGRDVAADLVPVAAGRGPVRIRGFAGLPRRTRGDARDQHVTLNGRPIRDKLVSSAVREAYQGFLMTRRFPVVFLALEAEPDAIDVNVHPAKLEVRFREPREVFPLVVRAIRAALEGAKVDPVLEPAAARAPCARAPAPAPVLAAPRSAIAASGLVKKFTSGGAGDGAGAGVGAGEGDGGWGAGDGAGAGPAVREAPVTYDLLAPPEVPPHLQLASGYLVVETGAGFEVIDPHALHERILYEELRARIARGSVEVQPLLVPVVVELSALEEARLEAAAGALAALGLVAEPFGPRTAAIQAVPAALSRVRDWAGVLRDLLDRIVEDWREAPGRGGGGKDGHLLPPDDAPGEDARAALLDGLTATMACKAAVKLGEHLAAGEVRALLERRAAADRSHLCPHGRPTALAFPASELERQFKR